VEVCHAEMRSSEFFSRVCSFLFDLQFEGSRFRSKGYHFSMFLVHKVFCMTASLREDACSNYWWEAGDVIVKFQLTADARVVLVRLASAKEDGVHV